LHAERVDLALILPPTDGRPVLASLDSFRKESGNDEAALTRLRKEFKLSQYRCATLLTQGQYQMLQVDAPNVPAAEMREAVRWRIKDLLDYSVQSATIDVLDIPVNGVAPGRAKSIFAIAAANSVIESRMNVFESAHIPLEVIDIPELAQRNIATLFEEKNRGLAMLSFDEYGGLLTFTYEGELYASRRIEISLNQLVDADSVQRNQHLERIGLELQRSLDHFDRQYSFISLAKLLVLPVPGVPELIEYLGANLYAPVKTFNLADVLDISAVPDLTEPSRQAQCLQTIGAALRAEGGTL